MKAKLVTAESLFEVLDGGISFWLNMKCIQLPSGDLNFRPIMIDRGDKSIRYLVTKAQIKS